MIKKLQLNALLLVTGFSLLASPLLRFSWDYSTQCLFHFLLLAAIFAAINYYEISFSINSDSTVIFFFAAASLSLIGAYAPAHVRNALFVLADGIIIYFLAGLLSAGQKRALFLIPVLLGFLFSLIFFIFFIQNPLGYFFTDLLPDEFIINPNIVAGYLLLAFLLSFAFWKDAAKPAVYSRLLSAAIFIGIFLTRSRWALLISSFFGIYLILSHFRHRPGKYKLALPFLLAALIFISFLKINTGTFLFDRMIWWKAAWKIFLDNPLKGAGWGNFETLYLLYRPALSINTLYAHNLLLQLLSDSGIFGFAAFFLMLYILLFKNTRDGSNMFPEKDIITVTIFGFLAFNLLDYGFYVPSHLLIFFAILGGISTRKNNLRTKPLVRLPILVILILLVAYPIYSFFSANIHADASARALAGGDAELAGAEIQKAVRQDPFSSDYLYQAAEISFKQFSLSNDGKYLNKAIIFQKKALQLNPVSAKMWADLAWLYSAQKDRKNASASMLNAVKNDRLNPNYPGILLKISGRNTYEK